MTLSLPNAPSLQAATKRSKSLMALPVSSPGPLSSFLVHLMLVDSGFPRERMTAVGILPESRSTSPDIGVDGNLRTRILLSEQVAAVIIGGSPSSSSLGGRAHSERLVTATPRLISRRWTMGCWKVGETRVSSSTGSNASEPEGCSLNRRPPLHIIVRPFEWPTTMTVEPLMDEREKS